MNSGLVVREVWAWLMEADCLCRDSFSLYFVLPLLVVRTGCGYPTGAL